MPSAIARYGRSRKSTAACVLLDWGRLTSPDGMVVAMDSVRYFLALIAWVSVPPALCFWLIIHPFIGFWRQLGAARTFVLVTLLLAALGVALFLVRNPLLSVEFGARSPLMVLGILCLAVAVTIGVMCRRQLTIRILIGLPELAREAETRTLLTEGIYARIRHPRYVEVMLGLLGWALLTNYLALYLLLALVVPAIHFVTVLEERELRDRFGEAYQAYSRKVPKFVPSLHSSR